jgi:RNA polymerase sigma-70 factor (ECF subfamily)
VADFRASIPLILLAQAGDRQALAQLLQSIQQALHAYLARLVNDEHLAEDILQDVFVLIWRKLRWLRDPELFRPWVYRIATREAFHGLKKQRFWSHLVSDAQLGAMAQNEPPERVPQDWLDQLPSHLAAVSPASRVVLLLHYLQGLTLEEVADVLALSPGTVKSRLAYGLAALRQRLGKKEVPHDGNTKA